MLFYLAGSIEYSPDLGKGWRAEITPLLQSLGHEVYDPALDEMKNLTETEVREFRSWKSTDLRRFSRPSAKSLPMILISLSIGAMRWSAIGTNTPGAARAHRAS